MVIHSTFEDFVLFLYVHVAHSDQSYDPLEISAIKSKMVTLFPAGVDIERKLYQTIREYNSFDKSKLAELCSDTLQHFKKDNDLVSPKLYDDVHDIVSADGRINPAEAEVLQKLKTLFDRATN